MKLQRRTFKTCVAAITRKSQAWIKLNISKTKILMVDRENHKRPDITHVKCLEEITYLELIINNGVCLKAKVRRRCESTKIDMKKFTTIFKDRQTFNVLRKGVVYSFVPFLFCKFS